MAEVINLGPGFDNFPNEGVKLAKTAEMWKSVSLYFFSLLHEILMEIYVSLHVINKIQTESKYSITNHIQVLTNEQDWFN